MRSRGRMIEASCTAGMAFTNAGLGINHSIAHALGGRFHVAHGRLNAVLLPHVMQFHMASDASRAPYERLAHELGLPSAHALLKRVCELCCALGVEHCLAELPQIDPTRLEVELDNIVTTAQHDRCTPTNPRPVSRQDFVNLCKFTLAGHSFLGWSTQPGKPEAGKLLEDKAMVKDLATDLPIKQVNLYAQWGKHGETYTIIFNKNAPEGVDPATVQGDMENQTMTYGEATALNENKFTLAVLFHHPKWLRP